MGIKRAFSKRLIAGLAAVLLGALYAGFVWSLEPKSEPDFGSREFFVPELYLSSSQLPVEEVLTELANRSAWESYRAGQPQPVPAFIDPRGGTATNILSSEPLIPGSGMGNQLSVQALSDRLGYSVAAVDAEVVADAFLVYVDEIRDVLGVDNRQLGPVHATQVTPNLWHVRIPQVYRGLPVRHGHLVATLNHGNVVVVGTETWGNVGNLTVAPTISADEARTIGLEHVDLLPAEVKPFRQPTLEVVPFAPPEHQEGEAFAGSVGQGFGHYLVWSLMFRTPPSTETWELLVDAHTGRVLAFQDRNHYLGEQLTGAVYPVTSTEICPTNGTCGEMQSGWPMPFADTGLAAPNDFTNSAGIFDNTGGASTTLSGRFVNINDNCGGVNASGPGSIDLGGTNGQHDCTTPGSGGAGNTPASRTAFYETNKLIEQAKGWLPGNTWLDNQLTANLNINNSCNAFWDFSTINFYRSGGGCRNTGELAGVFDHEWGHGLDDFDSGGILSNSSEAYADIVAIYRLQDSCVGHGFFETINSGCGMTSDGTGFNANEAQTGPAVCCTDCSGVRDADYARHSPATPATALGFVCNSCLTSSGPCGRQVHCAAAPSRQAAWDFVARDLQAAPFNLDSQTAFMIGNKVFYQGSGNIGLWHACTCGSSSDGCGATNGYMQWLAADDDNGNLNDGTPHMTALFDAFDRHGIACASPTPQNSGCSGGPTGTATLTATPGNRQVSLSWTSVPGASEYWVLRTEGHAGCDFGKAVIATVSGTSYTDSEVANGREYYYNVVAVGSTDACYGPVSNCANATPASGPDFGVSCTPNNLSIQQGMSDVSTCTVSSSGGFAGTIDLTCSGEPAGINCSFVPSSVTPPVNGSSNSTLTLSVDLGQATGTYNFDVVGSSGGTDRTVPMSVLVTPEGTNGPQDAVFDATLQAPACLTPGSSCDSTTLVNSRDSLTPSEPNQPNTIADSCADGESGSYHSDESNDRIVVSTLDGSDFSAGATVQVDATVWAWDTGAADTLDLFYTADANNPSWTLITSIVPPGGGEQTLSAQYTLPDGDLQAVRAQFRYLGDSDPCTSGGWTERDDLVFAVCSDLVLDNQTISTTEVYNACDQLIAGPDLHFDPTADVTLGADGGVGFRGTFRVALGAVMRVQTD